MEEPLETDALGDEVTSEVKIRRPTGIVVSARLERELAERLLNISETAGKTLSQLVREAILLYLERPPTEANFAFGTQIAMSTINGQMSSTFTVRNAVVTNSGLTDHSEHLVTAE